MVQRMVVNRKNRPIRQRKRTSLIGRQGKGNKKIRRQEREEGQRRIRIQERTERQRKRNQENLKTRKRNQ